MTDITPKPMSAERRAEIEKAAEARFGAVSREDITDLLADAAYWREAVRTADECPSDQCAFCLAHYDEPHKPDRCRWLLAQERGTP